SMSTKTGVQPSQTILLVVAINENGVVMISPFSSKALMAICSAMVPLVTKSRFFTSKWRFSFSSNSFAIGPMLVTHWVSQTLESKVSYSFLGGKKGLVTGIILQLYIGCFILPWKIRVWRIYF